jgi:hypothetical protein
MRWAIWPLAMTDPWCWYINANKKGVNIDGIHGAPYIYIYSIPMGYGVIQKFLRKFHHGASPETGVSPGTVWVRKSDGNPMASWLLSFRDVIDVPNSHWLIEGLEGTPLTIGK